MASGGSCKTSTSPPAGPSPTSRNDARLLTLVASPPSPLLFGGGGGGASHVECPAAVLRLSSLCSAAPLPALLPPSRPTLPDLPPSLPSSLPPSLPPWLPVEDGLTSLDQRAPSPPVLSHHSIYLGGAREQASSGIVSLGAAPIADRTGRKPAIYLAVLPSSLPPAPSLSLCQAPSLSLCQAPSLSLCRLTHAACVRTHTTHTKHTHKTRTKHTHTLTHSHAHTHTPA